MHRTNQRRKNYRAHRGSGTVRKCSGCNTVQVIVQGATPDGVPYSYYRCPGCREEVLSMEQLHEVSERYKMLKKHHAKITPWGRSLGIRIPKALAKKYKFSAQKEVIMIPEEHGIRLILAEN